VLKNDVHLKRFSNRKIAHLEQKAAEMPPPAVLPENPCVCVFSLNRKVTRA
jgi:hypothetical protein